MAGSLEIKVISEKLAYVYGGDADGVALMGLDVVADGAIEVRVTCLAACPGTAPALPCLYTCL